MSTGVSEFGEELVDHQQHDRGRAQDQDGGGHRPDDPRVERLEMTGLEMADDRAIAASPQEHERQTEDAEAHAERDER